MKKILVLMGLFAGGPALALDGCLVGVWNVDADDLAHVMGAQMGAATMYAGGDAFMEIFADGELNIYVTNLVINVQMPDIPPMNVKIHGFSEAIITASGGSWSLVGGEYNLTGSTEVMGQTMEIPFNSATGVFGGGNGIYGCSDETLTFEGSGEDVRMPRRWMRIIPDS